MPHEVKGVIAGARGAAVELKDILVPDPGPGDALVRAKVCGVCHTDLHCRKGAINDDFPFFLGMRRRVRWRLSVTAWTTSLPATL